MVAWRKQLGSTGAYKKLQHVVEQGHLPTRMTPTRALVHVAGINHGT